MKITQKPKWKMILIAALCLIGILALAGGSLSIYNNQAVQRGVARNKDNESARFSSDYLQACANGTETYPSRTITFSSDTTGDQIFEIHVYNYANGNENLVSQKDITYTMTIRFEGGTQGSYTVTYGNGQSMTTDQNLTCTASNMTLTGRTPQQHTYSITIPAADLDKVKITATAVPSSVAVTNNQILAAVIVPCTGTSEETFSYKGVFTDASEGSPRDYDGFNYEVSISGGRATATLAWKNDIVEIDQLFLKKLSDKTLSEGKLIFTMDQSAGTSDYRISFYIKNKNKIPASWPEMNSIITFTAEQQS